MTAGRPRICLLVGMTGSLSPTEAVAAARGIAEPVLILDRAEVASFPMLRTVAESLAESVIADTRDPDQVRDCVAASGASAVTTFVDACCPVVDEVNARLFGRPAEPGRWRKDVQRGLLVRHGVTSVTSSLVRTREDLSAAMARHGFPAVVKPARGVSSRDVWKLTGPADLRDFLSATRLDGDSAFVAEPYIPGPGIRRRGPHRADYLSVELFVTTAGAHSFITDRPPLARPCRETGVIAPTTVDVVTQAEVLAKAEQARQALGLGPGAYHVEIKLTDTEPEVLEVNGRLGGYVHRLVRLGTGADIAPLVIQAALDDPALDVPALDVLAGPGLDWRRHVAVLLMLAPVDAVRIAAAPRRRDIARLPGVLAVDHVSPPGERLDWRAGTGAACAMVWLAGEDDDEFGLRLTGCAAWLAREFDFRDAAGRRVRDDEWLEALAGPRQLAI